MSVLSDGMHTVQVPNGAAPWTTTWRVVSTGPVVQLAVKPAADSDTPSSSASFVFSSTSVPAPSYEYWLSPRDDVSTWHRASGASLSLSSLTPGVQYTLHVRGVDGFGVAGAEAAWSWQSAGCVDTTTAWQSLVRNVTATWVQYGQRVVTWLPAVGSGLSGYQYRVDGGEWVAVGAPPVLLTGVQRGVYHSVEVRAMASEVCGGASATMTLYLVATVTWFEYDDPPGRCVSSAGGRVCVGLCGSAVAIVYGCCVHTCLPVCWRVCGCACVVQSWDRVHAGIVTSQPVQHIHVQQHVVATADDVPVRGGRVVVVAVWRCRARGSPA